MTPDEFDQWFRELFWETWATYRRPLILVMALAVLLALGPALF